MFLDWQKNSDCGSHHWSGYGPMPGMGMDMRGMGMKMAMMGGMRCPVCGEPLLRPTNEEMMAILERKKKRLQAVIDHLNKEIETLKAAPQ